MLVIRMVRVVRIRYAFGSHMVRMGYAYGTHMVRLRYGYVLNIQMCVTFLNIISITYFT